MTKRSSGPAVIIGNPSSLFPRTLASYWRSLGMDVVIVTRHIWKGESILPDGTQILSSEDHEPADLTSGLNWASWVLSGLEEELHRLDEERSSRAMAQWGEPDFRPSCVPPLMDAVAISQCVLGLHPRFVFGQEAFAYGLATALCHGIPRILMPWGGDIYLFAETSPIAFAMMKYAVHQVDLVVPTSVLAARHICDRFDLPKWKTRPLSWGVDTKHFQRADPEARHKVCDRFGIEPSTTICMNVRRFRPPWGSQTAFKAFLRLAEEEPSCHFVLLGGSASEPYVQEARAQVAVRQLAHRFTLFDGEIPLSDCADLMSVSDVFFSLMRVPDMRSSSILQAAASGGVLVLSDQPEYREMERLGFRATFVNPDDSDAVVSSALPYIHNRTLREQIGRENQAFVLAHEDRDRQMNKLLRMIDRVTQSYSAAGAEAGEKTPEPESETPICQSTHVRREM